MLLVAQVACSTLPQRAIIGVWKSDADRTLASMRIAGNVTPEALRIYENDYYGHLVIEYRRDTVRAWFDNSDYDTGYQPYEVVEVAPDHVVTREWNELLGRYQLTTTYMEGACIYGIAAEFGFREYYCPNGQARVGPGRGNR